MVDCLNDPLVQVDCYGNDDLSLNFDNSPFSFNDISFDVSSAQIAEHCLSIMHPCSHLSLFRRIACSLQPFFFRSSFKCFVRYGGHWSRLFVILSPDPVESVQSFDASFDLYLISRPCFSLVKTTLDEG